jgi:hypothetical protein
VASFGDVTPYILGSKGNSLDYRNGATMSLSASATPQSNRRRHGRSAVGGEADLCSAASDFRV